MKAPRAALLCALIIALFFTGQAQENSEEEKESGDESTDVTHKVEPTDEDTTIISTVAALTTEVDYRNNTFGNEKDTQLEFILMVLVPLVFLALLLISVVLIVINCKRKKAKQELPSSQGSQSVLQTYEPGGDNMKLPIFEEDTPSVMEIEMEELDKWMSMHRNADSECLPTLKEEKESNHSPSDNES
ncbi:transmembrane protein 154 [Pipistrellus kuhlii]|uniref:Transmembrane protein 154 n=1 Tax=Pipistrellus kuhlii TaxID=59472 RepID=A0A7J7XDE6_PIPKU|nr:transmembrane protein 154 [Pipistrellus kuhlii]KAF6347538.1 transmembrane protein 154 [Pipistrellus kuhlii]